MRRPFPDDRMPSEVPRKSLPRKRSFLRGDAHLRKQPASQPASKRTPHEQAAEAKAMLCVHKGRGVFFFFLLKAKKIPNLKKQLQ
jgi:hypothetical protein